MRGRDVGRWVGTVSKRVGTSRRVQRGAQRERAREARSGSLWLACVLAGLVVLAGLAGCASGPPDRPGTENYVVDKIVLEGVESVERNDLLDVLETSENSFNPFASTQWLNRFSVVTDIDRIRTFYQMRGFFDVEVTDHRVEYEEGRRRGQATVFYEIVEGERTTLTVMGCDVGALRNVDQSAFVRGIGFPREMENRCGRMMPPTRALEDPSWVDRRPPSVEGVPFDWATIEAARATLRRRLLEEGYAYARVEARTYVDRENRTAEVYYFFDQGPVCLFGDVEIEGNRQIPNDLIRTSISIMPGNRYRHSLLRRAQVDLYGLNVFSFVQVEARLAAPEAVRGAGAEETPNLEDPDGDAPQPEAEETPNLEDPDGDAPQPEAPVEPAPAPCEAPEEDPRQDPPSTEDVPEPGSEGGADAGGWMSQGAASGESGARSRDEVHADALARGLLLAAVVTDPEPSREVRVASLLDRLGGGGDVGVCRVPIDIQVSEQPGANYRVGGGLGIASGRTESYGRANALWRNVVSPLNQIEADLRLGYAWLPSLFADEVLVEGIIGIGGIAYRRPRAIFNYFDFTTGLRYERNLRDDYTFTRPTATIGVARRFTEFTRFELNYSIDIVRTDDDLELGGTSCQAVPEQYQLSRINSVVQTDRRDNPLNAREGFYTELSVELGEDFALGDFPYVLVRPEARYYYPVSRRLSIGLRVAAGSLIDFGNNVPRSQCLYLGGGETLRGFPERRMSPYESGVATGGLTSWLINIEPRFELGRNWLYGVVFLDIGAVSSRQLDFSTRLGGAEGVHLATGGGLRLMTPIGPIRFDLGYRVTSGPEYGPTVRDRLAFFLSIGEAF